MSAPPPFVHPTAIVDPGAHVGAGSKIWHFAHVMSGARLGEDVVLGQNVYVASTAIVGDHCRVQNNVSLYDGVVLERGVFVGPSAVFTNVRRPRALFPRKGAYDATLVGEGATLGANATIVCGVRIGACAMIGAGAVITRDVPSFALVVGNPPRRIGWVCRCGERLPASHAGGTVACTACRRAYLLEGERLSERAAV
jgi:UDP-2-acetamido-3-amino-2,3-dideoxy-glucuronate N-acetyltransferase